MHTLSNIKHIKLLLPVAVPTDLSATGWCPHQPEMRGLINAQTSNTSNSATGWCPHQPETLSLIWIATDTEE